MGWKFLTPFKGFQFKNIFCFMQLLRFDLAMKVLYPIYL